MNDKIKVIFLKNAIGVGLAYFKDDVAFLNPPAYDDLFDMGYVEKYDGDVPNDGSLPFDIPGIQKLIKAGFESLDEIAKVEDLTIIQGIGKVLSKQIIEYINK